MGKHRCMPRMQSTVYGKGHTAAHTGMSAQDGTTDDRGRDAIIDRYNERLTEMAKETVEEMTGGEESGKRECASSAPFRCKQAPITRVVAKTRSL